VLEAELRHYRGWRRASAADFTRARRDHPDPSRQVIVTGLGKSGQVAQKIAATFPAQERLPFFCTPRTLFSAISA